MFSLQAVLDFFSGAGQAEGAPNCTSLSGTTDQHHQEHDVRDSSEPPHNDDAAIHHAPDVHAGSLRGGFQGPNAAQMAMQPQSGAATATAPWRYDHHHPTAQQQQQQQHGVIPPNGYLQQQHPTVLTSGSGLMSTARTATRPTATGATAQFHHAHFGASGFQPNNPVPQAAGFVHGQLQQPPRGTTGSASSGSAAHCAQTHQQIRPPVSSRSAGAQDHTSRVGGTCTTGTGRLHLHQPEHHSLQHSNHTASTPPGQGGGISNPFPTKPPHPSFAGAGLGHTVGSSSGSLGSGGPFAMRGDGPAPPRQYFQPAQAGGRTQNRVAPADQQNQKMKVYAVDDKRGAMMGGTVGVSHLGLVAIGKEDDQPKYYADISAPLPSSGSRRCVYSNRIPEAVLAKLVGHKGARTRRTRDAKGKIIPNPQTGKPLRVLPRCLGEVTVNEWFKLDGAVREVARKCDYDISYSRILLGNWQRVSTSNLPQMRMNCQRVLRWLQVLFPDLLRWDVLDILSWEPRLPANDAEVRYRRSIPLSVSPPRSRKVHSFQFGPNHLPPVADGGSQPGSSPADSPEQVASKPASGVPLAKRLHHDSAAGPVGEVIVSTLFDDIVAVGPLSSNAGDHAASRAPSTVSSGGGPRSSALGSGGAAPRSTSILSLGSSTNAQGTSAGPPRSCGGSSSSSVRDGVSAGQQSAGTDPAHRQKRDAPKIFSVGSSSSRRADPQPHGRSAVDAVLETPKLLRSPESGAESPLVPPYPPAAARSRDQAATAGPAPMDVEPSGAPVNANPQRAEDEASRRQAPPFQVARAPAFHTQHDQTWSSKLQRPATLRTQQAPAVQQPTGAGTPARPLPMTRSYGPKPGLLPVQPVASTQAQRQEANNNNLHQLKRRTADIALNQQCRSSSATAPAPTYSGGAGGMDYVPFNYQMNANGGLTGSLGGALQMGRNKSVLQPDLFYTSAQRFDQYISDCATWLDPFSGSTVLLPKAGGSGAFTAVERRKILSSAIAHKVKMQEVLLVETEGTLLLPRVVLKNLMGGDSDIWTDEHLHLANTSHSDAPPTMTSYSFSLQALNQASPRFEYRDVSHFMEHQNKALSTEISRRVCLNHRGRERPTATMVRFSEEIEQASRGFPDVGPWSLFAQAEEFRFKDYQSRGGGGSYYRAEEKIEQVVRHMRGLVAPQFAAALVASAAVPAIFLNVVAGGCSGWGLEQWARLLALLPAGFQVDYDEAAGQNKLFFSPGGQRGMETAMLGEAAVVVDGTGPPRPARAEAEDELAVADADDTRTNTSGGAVAGALIVSRGRAQVSKSKQKRIPRVAVQPAERIALAMVLSNFHPHLPVYFVSFATAMYFINESDFTERALYLYSAEQGCSTTSTQADKDGPPASSSLAEVGPRGDVLGSSSPAVAVERRNVRGTPADTAGPTSSGRLTGAISGEEAALRGGKAKESGGERHLASSGL